MLLGISSQIFANELICPYGCGSSTDPDVGNVGKVLLQSLEKIDFLEGTTTIGCDDGDYGEFYEQVLGGQTWQLLYRASYEYYNDEDIEEEEDELQSAVEYHFSREKLWEENSYQHSDAFETNLSNYLETNAFIQTVFGDIHFCFDNAQKEELLNIEDYRRRIAQNLSHEENQYYLSRIDSEQRSLDRESLEHSRRMNVIESAQAHVKEIYTNIFNDCIANHNWHGSFYCRGLLNFQEGYFIDAFDDISQYLKSASRKEDGNIFLAEVYFYKGLLESEMGIYNAAIESLNRAIKANPGNKEAYFERAVAYYELGEFDLSLEDYLMSGIKPHPITPDSLSMISFSLGMTKGILMGGAQAGIEFIPSLLSSLQGISHGLWAFAQDPVQVSIELVQSAQACVHFIKNNSSQKVLGQLVPELRELFEQWEQLHDEKIGEIIGYVIGKYGVDIFAGAGVAKGVKLYRDLKKANDLLTFEAMAISEKNRALIKLESSRRAQARQQILQHTNLKIQGDKQGKHIVGHKSYDPLLNKSILEHPDPQKLVRDFAGTGLKVNQIYPGSFGFQEIVNFKEFIGYSVHPQTGEKIATSWGKIHYAKDGVHIVPTKPR